MLEEFTPGKWGYAPTIISRKLNFKLEIIVTHILYPATGRGSKSLGLNNQLDE